VKLIQPAHSRVSGNRARLGTPLARRAIAFGESVPETTDGKYNGVATLVGAGFNPAWRPIPVRENYRHQRLSRSLFGNISGRR
jgi:hypothetical protein